jgi:transposase InsO family protein
MYCHSGPRSCCRQTIDTLTHELNYFIYHYNYERRHGALDYKTPLDRLTSVTELLK